MPGGGLQILTITITNLNRRDMLCVSNLCFFFLEEFLEKEEAEWVEMLLVNWHMGPGTLQVFRYCTLGESR